MNTLEPLKIGFPTNCRIAQDCKPIRDALELKDEPGRLTSRFLPNTIIRPTRVNDIARCLKEGIFALGILGDDTAIENDLEQPNRPAKDFDNSLVFIGNQVISADNKKMLLDLPPTMMTLFAEEQRIRNLQYPYELFQQGPIATPYPRTAQKLMLKLYKSMPIVMKNEGGTEAIVANRDGGVVGGYDIVRTGNTLKKFNLVPWITTLDSRPGLWQSPKTDPTRKNELEDVLGIITDRLRPLCAELWDR